MFKRLLTGVYPQTKTRLTPFHYQLAGSHHTASDAPNKACKRSLLLRIGENPHAVEMCRAVGETPSPVGQLHIQVNVLVWRRPKRWMTVTARQPPALPGVPQHDARTTNAAAQETTALFAGTAPPAAPRGPASPLSHPYDSIPAAVVPTIKFKLATLAQKIVQLRELRPMRAHEVNSLDSEDVIVP